MVVEKYLRMQACRENGAGSAGSRTSVLTLKSAHTLRIGQADSRSTRSSISSRARQIKDHENDPFLSIGVLPKTSIQSSLRKDPGPATYSAKMIQLSRPTTSSGRPTSVYSCRQDDELAGVFSRYVSAIRPASLISQARLPQPENVYVRTPFKQVADVPCIKKTRVMSTSPGQALTESTTLAVQIASEILNEHKQQKNVHIRGRLLKARLKNLDPVMVEGPTIVQCRGITSETRTPLACNRRTYHRLMAVLSKAHAPTDMVQDINNPVPVHHTSQASSLDSGICAALVNNNYLNKNRIGGKTCREENNQ